jgi:hypothetical protein
LRYLDRAFFYPNLDQKCTYCFPKFSYKIIDVSVTGLYDDGLKIFPFVFRDRTPNVDSGTVRIPYDTVFFSYDTASNKYVQSIPIRFEFFNNKADSVLFTDWKILIDSSFSLSLVDSIAIQPIKVPPRHEENNFPFDFQSNLPPLAKATTFSGAVECHAHFVGKDSICIIPLNFHFDQGPKSAVYFNVLNKNNFTIYPNPSSGNVEINCSFLKSSFLHLHIFDELGKDIMTVYDGMAAEGPRDFSFKLPQGMYYVRMETAEGVATKKIVVE